MCNRRLEKTWFIGNIGHNVGLNVFNFNNATCLQVVDLLFQVVNHHLLHDLVDLGLWDEDMKNQLIQENGSVQVINCSTQCRVYN